MSKKKKLSPATPRRRSDEEIIDDVMPTDRYYNQLVDISERIELLADASMPDESIPDDEVLRAALFERDPMAEFHHHTIRAMVELDSMINDRRRWLLADERLAEQEDEDESNETDTPGPGETGAPPAPESPPTQ